MDFLNLSPMDFPNIQDLEDLPPEFVHFTVLKTYNFYLLKNHKILIINALLFRTKFCKSVDGIRP